MTSFLTAMATKNKVQSDNIRSTKICLWPFNHFWPKVLDPGKEMSILCFLSSGLNFCPVLWALHWAPNGIKPPYGSKRAVSGRFFRNAFQRRDERFSGRVSHFWRIKFFKDLLIYREQWEPFYYGPPLLFTIAQQIPLAKVAEEQERWNNEQGAKLRTWEQRKTRERNLVDRCKRGIETRRGETSCGEPLLEGGAEPGGEQEKET